MGIVNDVPLLQEMLRRIVARETDHEVVWLADDGEQAVTRCAADRPDIILMDLIMPGLDGVEATRKIMARCPCAVLIVTASVDANRDLVFRALGAGALDAVAVPRGGANGIDSAALVAKLNAVALRIGHKPAALATQLAASPALVLLGASAGGPGALSTVLAGLPSNLPAAVVVALHLDDAFAAGLVGWLGGPGATLPVKAAVAGAMPRVGEVVVACDGHLRIDDRQRWRTGAVGEPSIYRPCIDTLFASAAENWRGDVIAVILTGMGKDGAQGLLTLRKAGHHTIAQDEATSAIYGMPREAVRLGAAREELPLPQIAPAIRRALGLARRPTR